ncbi:MAG: helix-turn-helix transcriptional regulator [Pseudomonadota bacterium]
MTANVLPFPSRRLPIDPERREVVKVVGLRDAFDVQLNHEGGSGDHVAVFPAQPRHPRRPKMRTGLGIGERALPLPLLQFSGSSLHSKAGNTMRYNLTIPCNAIRSCVVTATVLSFLRMEDMPNRILELRRAAKLSQEELGFRVGVSKMQISGMERGKRELSLGMMRRLAEALDVSPADLLCDEDNPMRLATDERALLSRYRAADPEQQRNIERVTEALVPFNQRQRDAA